MLEVSTKKTGQWGRMWMLKNRRWEECQGSIWRLPHCLHSKMWTRAMFKIFRLGSVWHSLKQYKQMFQGKKKNKHPVVTEYKAWVEGGGGRHQIAQMWLYHQRKSETQLRRVMQVPVHDAGGLEWMDTWSQADPKPDSLVQESRPMLGAVRGLWNGKQETRFLVSS